jgi:hypothetical protein
MDTFVIRAWTPAEEGDIVDEPLRLCGLVEHVRLGERRAFDGEEQLLTFIRASISRPPSHTASSRTRHPQSEGEEDVIGRNLSVNADGTAPNTIHTKGER